MATGNKYVINLSTSTLHKVNGGCCNSKPYNCKYYKTMDEVVSDNPKGFSKCKVCFKDE